MYAEESTYVNVIASKRGKFFVLKGAFCESLKIRFLKTAHRFQWIKIENNWEILFSTPNEATAPMSRLKFAKRPISSHPIMGKLTYTVGIILPRRSIIFPTPGSKKIW